MSIVNFDLKLKSVFAPHAKAALLVAAGLVYSGSAIASTDLDLNTTPSVRFVEFTGSMPPSGSAGDLAAPVGDFNNDGFDDFVIGSPFGESSVGVAYLVLGKASGFGDLDLTTFATDNTNGFKISGDSFVLGLSVESAGDYNNDGFDDFLVATQNNAYLILGRSTGLTNFNVSLFNSSNARGFKISGSFNSVETLAGNVDVNNDGYDDLIIGGPAIDISYGDDAGKVFVLFGKGSGIGNINLATFTASDQNGYYIIGQEDRDLGYTVRSAGDFNNDGFGDIVVCGSGVYSELYTPDHKSGPGFLVLGRASGFVNVDLRNDPPPSDFVLVSATGLGVNAATHFYGGLRPIGNAGDINNDGFSDMVVGVPDADSKSGAAIVVYGHDITTDSISLASIGGANNDGFRVNGFPNAYLGSSVGAAGDINGDGYDDLQILSYKGSSGTTSSITYVIHGNAGLTGTYDAETLATGNGGFKITGPLLQNLHVPQLAAAGDVNDDGFDDFLNVFGATVAPSSAGYNYLIFGGDDSTAAVRDWNLY